MNNSAYTQLLKEWPHEPGKLSARLVQDSYGTSHVQVRVELGILQMELSGRPDGGVSVFETRFGADLNPGVGGLDSELCRVLHREAALYAYRALVCSSLELHERVVADASRNLEVMDFMIAHANDASDRQAARALRVQSLVMRVRARASHALASQTPAIARSLVEDGIQEVQAALRLAGRSEEVESAAEIQLLRSLVEVLIPKLPASQRHEMELRLKAALEVENYELAAILTNELRQLF